MKVGIAEERRTRDDKWKEIGVEEKEKKYIKERGGEDK